MGLRLSKLGYGDLLKHPAWLATGDYAEDEDTELEPVMMDDSGRLPSSLGEVWCLCSARFADGSEHLACAMCRADCDDGPLLWTVWNGEDDVPLFVPPAPLPVLLKDGPEPFAKNFGRTLEEVFPLSISVDPRFATPPERRSEIIRTNGIG